jgi:predicted transcriptional regulator of viral defense system
MNTSPNHNHLYQIAEGQAGYFTARQAGEAGFSAERLTNSCKAGNMFRVAWGVYRLTRFPGSPFEDLFVAWLSTGPNSVISHESALAVYQLTDVLPGEIHVIIPRSASRRHAGIRLHTNRLEPGDITTREGLPVTTPARTIADLAVSGLSGELVRQAVQEALRRGLTTSKELLSQAARRGRKAMQLIQKASEVDHHHEI